MSYYHERSEFEQSIPDTIQNHEKRSPMKLKTKNSAFNSSHTSLLCVVASTLFLASNSSHAATTIYSDNFSGDSSALNGATTTTGGGTWNANLIANRDGTLNSALGNGSAVLPVALSTNMIYTLSMDITVTSGFYLFMGFTQNNIASAGANSAADRYNNASMGAFAVMAGVVSGSLIQGADRYNEVLASTNAYTVSTTHNYKMSLDTTGDGSSAKATYFVDGVAFGTDLTID